MTTADSDIATRILTSSAAASSPLDHGFIAYLLNPRGAGWRNDENIGHACNFTFLEKLVNASGANTLIKVDPDHPEPLYQNSLYWIRHQDIPDLPPPKDALASTSPTTAGNTAREDRQGNEADVHADYVTRALELLKSHQHAHPPRTRSEKKSAYRMHALEHQMTMTSLLRNFIESRFKNL
jgi:hypothetical protein